VGDKVILSTKDFMFKEQLVRKSVDQYISLYIIDEVVSTNAVKLQLPTLMRIHLCYKTRVWTDFRVRVSGQE